MHDRGKHIGIGIKIWSCSVMKKKHKKHGHVTIRLSFFIIEFHYYIWNRHGKCIEISPNMPSIGQVGRHISHISSYPIMPCWILLVIVWSNISGHLEWGIRIRNYSLVKGSSRVVHIQTKMFDKKTPSQNKIILHTCQLIPDRVWQVWGMLQ